jgi:cyclopropane-fatty-acyl-phospholipid synthase
MSKKMKKAVEKMFSAADVKINGSRPWDIKVNNERFYQRVLSGGLLGIGESYMDGDWDCAKLDELSFRACSIGVDKMIRNLSFGEKLQAITSKIINMQSKKRSYAVGEEHYDVGNELYKYMLDKRMVYTCGYWRNGAKNLDQAQEAKLDMVCKKIGLKKGQVILDIGCGWGSFLKFAAQKYGAIGVGVTVSKEQMALAEESCKGLPITFKYQDYREPILDKKGKEYQFDHIISLGMFEHVGPKNYKTYMEVAARHLKPKGIFLLHTIGQPISQTTNDPWTHKYIFPNSLAPSVAQIAKSAEGKFHIEDLHVFGTDYDPTAMAWYANTMKNWDKIKKITDKNGKVKYDERFRRMWEFYLLGVAGMARSQKATLWQFVLTKGEIPKGYRALRY